MNTIFHRINGFSDFVRRSNSKELEDKNVTFQKLDLFLPSGDPVSKTSCFYLLIF
jgi:hypothetical protein